jgi:hypothetical protein
MSRLHAGIPTVVDTLQSFQSGCSNLFLSKLDSSVESTHVSFSEKGVPALVAELSRASPNGFSTES